MPMGRSCLLAAAIALALAAASDVAAAPPAQPARPGGAVALLPLDAGARLEIYGQAVATEIARALMAGGVEVVVVGADMDVPASARLIVDGAVATDKGGLVALSMRVRDPADGAVLDTLSATAPSLAQIDRAAAELSARVLPVVRERLAALTAGRAGGDPGRPRSPGGGSPRVLLVGVASTAAAEPLRGALAGAAERWVRAARREPRAVEPRTLEGKLAPPAVASADAERAVTFEILRYAVASVGPARDVPLARARVRVRIADRSEVRFDRVVATDTIVGDRGMPAAALAARVAEEVLAILRPHVRRVVSPWP
jgi:hypothetical protein